MSDVLENIWAKSPTKEGASGETLAEHTRRVVRALEGLMSLRPGLPARLQWGAFWHTAFWACCFHDLGKVARGFQAQLRGDGSPWGQRHEVLSLCFLDWLPLQDDEFTWAAAAIASHHRDQRVIARKYPPGLDEEDDPLTCLVEDVPMEQVSAVYNWLSDWANHEVEKAGLSLFGVRSVAFRGMATNKDGLRSAAEIALRRYHNLVADLNRQCGAAQDVRIGLLIRGAVVSADRLGSAHAPGLVPVMLGGREGVLSVLERPWNTLHQHQTAAAEAQSDTVLVAPTGSGKTEAALLWAASGGGADAPRLFYMLPYQASINAMYGRLQPYAPNHVGLQHGRSLHALYRRLLEQEMAPERASAIARREQSLARLNYPAVRVLTPYQILKACFRLKGYEAILSDLEGACFVLDEVHAYEASRLAMILGMAAYLKERFGAKWFVMSATLPSLVADAIATAMGSPSVIRANAELFERFQRHVLHLLDGDLRHPQNLARIREAALRGLVLVCCNTVRKAQQLRSMIETLVHNDGVDVLLLHGGFNARDRHDREEAVMARVGVTGDQVRRPLVLVATQAVEVSLNLSFDTIFTDPAPLDALIQRFGRVHRVPDGTLRPVHVLREPQDGQHVYDGQLVRQAMAVLEEHDGEAVDEESVGAWLDAIYTGTIADAWRSAYDRQLAEFQRGVLDTLRPFGSDDALEDSFYSAFDAVEGLPASLAAEYDTLSETDPIAAGELLVSLRTYAVARLREQGRLENRTETRPLLLHVPYDSDLGLQLNDD